MFLGYKTKEMAENVAPRVQREGSCWTRPLDALRGKFQAKLVLYFSGLRKLSIKPRQARETSCIGRLEQVVVIMKFLCWRSED